MKPGARITKTHKEDDLFDNMFEIILNEDYEDHYQFREMEKAMIEARNRDEFLTMTNRKTLRKSPSKQSKAVLNPINPFLGS